MNLIELRAACFEIVATIDAMAGTVPSEPLQEALNKQLAVLDPLFGARSGLVNETGGLSMNVLVDRECLHSVLTALNSANVQHTLELWALRDFAFQASPIAVLTKQFNLQTGDKNVG